MPDLVKALHSGRVLLMDGAMGTELLRAGVPREACLEELNLTQPEVVKAVHRSYVEAGAEVLLTNTFQANPRRLSGTAEFRAACAAACKLARGVAGQRRLVFFDIGPYQYSMPGLVAEKIVEIALTQDVDGILTETCSTEEYSAQILKSKRRSGVKKNRLPVLFSWTFARGTDGTIQNGKKDPATCARLAVALGFAGLGVNCGREVGKDELLAIVHAYRSVTDLPLFVRPNAGTPKLIDGRWVYPETPESMAAWLPELFKAGVVMVGGCCGTTPAHIAAFRKVVDEWNAAHGRSEAEF